MMHKLRHEGYIGIGQEIEVRWGQKKKNVSVKEFSSGPKSLHGFMLPTWDST